MVSVSPVFVLLAVVADTAGDASQVNPLAWAAGITSALLVTVGVPMIIFGAQNVPAAQAPHAMLVPWATPSSGGLTMQLHL